MSYQPKTGARCHCKAGQARDNCPDCEGTGWRIDFAAIRAKTTVHNPNCDGSGPCVINGEVRVLPTGGESNAILCRRCYQHEIAFRKERNHLLGRAFRFKLPEWDTLKVYGMEET
jgi:hypothetical protein